MTPLPEVSRTYINHHLDSTRWDVYQPRGSDIIVTTSLKCGTTLTQQILYNLLIKSTTDLEVFPNIDMVSPWVDAGFLPLTKEKLGAWLESFKHRRFLKSHLPLDGLPYYEDVKYIIVARDPRDVFMSLLNHYSAYTDVAYKRLGREGLAPMPRYDGDAHAFFRNWLTRGWFEWEKEGYPFWSNMHHTQSYWDYRHLSNFLFLHYTDMRSDLPRAVKQICEFIEHPVDEDEVQRVVDAVSFDQVKKQAEAESSRQTTSGQISSRQTQVSFFDGGQATFINKGTNGRWREFLTEEELNLYRETRDRVLTPECTNWLEKGGDLPSLSSPLDNL